MLILSSMEEKREIIYSDISSASRKQPYDAMVYLDKGKVIAVDSNGKVIAKGTAGTDDATVIQAAIDATPVRGTVEIAPGSYIITSEITIQKHLNIRGDNPVLTSTLSGVAHEYVFKCIGSANDPISLEDSASPAGKNSWQTITIPESMELSPGMLVILCDDTLWSPADYETLKTAEIHHVQSVDGTVVTLSDHLIHTYEVGNNATITAIEPIEIHISGLTLIGPSRTGDAYGIRFEKTVSSTILNCTMSKFGYIACAINDSYGATVSNCTIYQCSKDGTGYGVGLLNATTNTMVTTNHMWDCRHCFTLGGDYTRGQSRGVAVTNNIFTTGINSAIDAHPYCEDILISGNKISHGMDHSATLIGAKNITIVGNESRGCSFSLRGNPDIDQILFANNTAYGVNSGLLADAANHPTIASLTIIGNSCYDSDWGIMLYPTSVETVHIANNVIDAPRARYGGVITIDCMDEDATTIRNTTVSNNVIVRSGADGIYLRYLQGSIVTDNIICNVSQNEDAKFYGIVATGRIERNYIYFTPDSLVDHVLIDIKAGEGSYIRDNIITAPCGVDRTPIECTSPAAISGNIGYVTENSGAAATVADGGTIAHGCVEAPTKVTLTGSVAGEIVTVTSIDATNITVAIKKPDNTTGTTQTIYWRAEV